MLYTNLPVQPGLKRLSKYTPIELQTISLLFTFFLVSTCFVNWGLAHPARMNHPKGGIKGNSVVDWNGPRGSDYGPVKGSYYSQSKCGGRAKGSDQMPDIMNYDGWSTEDFGGSPYEEHRRVRRDKVCSTVWLANAVVFDAGSTGTRANTYKFNVTWSEEEKSVKLVLGDINSTKPGLSSYADDPKECLPGLIKLMSHVDTLVGVGERRTTPLVLKATAGLRLLPQEKSDAILKTVRQYFGNTSYLHPPDDVSIMDGGDEGFYAWITINYLLGSFSNAETVATFDLGGSSTQIAYKPQDIQKIPAGAKVSKTVLGEKVTLYAKSYLGFGARDARAGIVSNFKRNQGSYRFRQLTYGRSPCFPYGAWANWTYHGHKYYIQGALGDCYSNVRYFFNTSKTSFDKPKGLNDQGLAGISYFYWSSTMVGMVDKAQNAGKVRVMDVYLAAKRICGAYFNKFEQDVSAPESEDDTFLDLYNKYNGKKKDDNTSVFLDNIFICLDLTYQVVLLRCGYGLGWQKELSLYNEINGIDTSWALGVGLSLLQLSD